MLILVLLPLSKDFPEISRETVLYSRGRSRSLVLRMNEKDRIRSSGDEKSQCKCMHHEDFASIFIGLIYYDETLPVVELLKS